MVEVKSQLPSNDPISDVGLVQGALWGYKKGAVNQMPSG